MKTFKEWVDSEKNIVQLFAEEASKIGWKVEWASIPPSWKSNPNALKFGSSTYPTLISPDNKVKVALDSRSINPHKGYVSVSMHGEPNSITIAGIYVDPEHRRSGLGTMAMEFLKSLADKLHIRLQLEPAQIADLIKKGEKAPSSSKLLKWYKKLGFTDKVSGISDVLHYDKRSIV